MKSMTMFKLLAVCIPVTLLAACGGGNDLEDRLDVADPVVRFVHASPIAPSLTLYRANVAIPEDTALPYKGASNYVDVSTGGADWTVKTADTAALTIGTVTLDPSRGNKYTFVALPATSTDSSVYVIADPYNKPLTSQSTRVRLMNAAFNAGSVDLYLNAAGTDIAGVSPLVAATAYKTSGPPSGSDSVDVPGASYQLTVTAAGTKTVLFRGTLAFGNNQDVLLLAVPDLTVSGGIRMLVKIEGTAGTTEIAPAA